MSETRRILCTPCSIIPCSALVRGSSVNYSWGADALATMHDYVVAAMFYVQALCCAIAEICVIVSGLQIYVKTNTGKDGITKSVVTLVGAYLSLIDAFLVFPAFFGYRIQKRETGIEHRYNDSKGLQYLP